MSNFVDQEIILLIMKHELEEVSYFQIICFKSFINKFYHDCKSLPSVDRLKMINRNLIVSQCNVVCQDLSCVKCVAIHWPSLLQMLAHIVYSNVLCVFCTCCINSTPITGKY